MPEAVSTHFMDYLPMLFIGVISAIVGIVVVLILVSVIAFSYIKNDEIYKLRKEIKSLKQKECNCDKQQKSRTNNPGKI